MAISIPITRAMKLSGYSPGRFYWNIQRGAIKAIISNQRRTISTEEIGRLLREEEQRLEAARRDHAQRYREFCEFVRRGQAASHANGKSGE